MSKLYETKDIKRLYTQLKQEKTEFCADLHWFSEKALQSDSPDRFTQMWKIYLSVMFYYGKEVFHHDVRQNPHSVYLNSVLKNLLKKDAYKKLIQLMLGAHNLFDQIQSPLYYAVGNHLNDTIVQYYSITRQYLDNGILESDNNHYKWSYIHDSYELFKKAYDIINLIAFSG